MPLYDEFVTTLVGEINGSALHTYNHGVTYDPVYLAAAIGCNLQCK